MKTKINIAIIIVIASISLVACTEEEINVKPPQSTAGIVNTHAPIIK
jgi:hypothetical protein